MKLKYYLRGLGTGILFATIVLFVSYSYKMSDKQIKEKALELGTIEISKSENLRLCPVCKKNLILQTQDQLANDKLKHLKNCQ